MPYVLILSCIALFAFDALAERLKVSRSRRAVLCVTEAVLLWPAVALWGHPEDAVAVALATYALIFTLDKRFVGAGWLFGAAVAFQPLVLLMLPVLLAVAGRPRMFGMAVRSVLPAAVLITGPLIANFSATFRTLTEQPNFPNLNHQTPWTALSPHLGGQGLDETVAGGPGRVLAIVLSVGIGIWVARHWRDQPDRIVLACAVALALRCYTESVMDDYYLWASLAVGVVVAARCNRWRFLAAVALAIAATVFAQRALGWVPWWMIQIGALTALLVVAAKPQPVVLATPAAEPVGARIGTGRQGGSRSKSGGKKRKAPPPSVKRASRR
jgi:hypothetical protein